MCACRILLMVLDKLINEVLSRARAKVHFVYLFTAYKMRMTENLSPPLFLVRQNTRKGAYSPFLCVSTTLPR